MQSRDQTAPRGEPAVVTCDFYGHHVRPTSGKSSMHPPRPEQLGPMPSTSWVSASHGLSARQIERRNDCHLQDGMTQVQTDSFHAGREQSH